ncbi:PLP-dependent aminotransferase family protein [Streptomyces sp. cg35]|uniref:aminotransferase-like domain-containing protein n=1 Tax=Streptomyces sp. cg35 TaxID=3421650 RepID=UPI003D16984B
MSRITVPRLSRLLTGWAADGPGALPRRLATALAELADRGDLPPGTVLPSQRELAAVLGVSRSTVTAAYAILEGDGRLESRRGSGSRLRGPGAPDRRGGEGRLASFDFRSGMLDLSSGALPGLPLVADALAALRPADLHGPLATDGYHPHGLPELREGIAASYRSAGLPTAAEQILVTTGSQQAVWLIAQALVEPGDTVVVENPTYRGALEALRARGARLVPVGGDRPGAGRDGADVEALRALLRTSLRPRLVYLQPSAHNPTGRSWDSAARQAWSTTLTEHGLVAVEDSSCAELSLSGDDAAPPVPLPASDFTIGTFSKLFWGGLRIGWVRASPTAVARLGGIKKAIDLSCPVLDQLLAVRLLARLPEARAARRAALRGRLATAQALVREQAPDWVWDRPSGGTALWVRVPGADTEALAQLARRRGVAVVPGPAFSAVDGFRDRLRVPFAHGPGMLEAALPVLRECAERSVPRP